MKKNNVFNGLVAAAFIVKYEKRKHRPLTQYRLMALMYIAQAYCCFVCKELFFTSSICVSFLDLTFSIQGISYNQFLFNGLYGTGGIRFYPPPLKKRRSLKYILNVCSKYTTFELYQKIIAEPFFSSSETYKKKRFNITSKMMIDYYEDKQIL